MTPKIDPGKEPEKSQNCFSPTTMYRSDACRNLRGSSFNQKLKALLLFFEGESKSRATIVPSLLFLATHFPLCLWYLIKILRSIFLEIWKGLISMSLGWTSPHSRRCNDTKLCKLFFVHKYVLAEKVPGLVLVIWSARRSLESLFARPRYLKFHKSKFCKRHVYLSKSKDARANNFFVLSAITRKSPEESSWNFQVEFEKEERWARGLIFHAWLASSGYQSDACAAFWELLWASSWKI